MLTYVRYNNLFSFMHITNYSINNIHLPSTLSIYIVYNNCLKINEIVIIFKILTYVIF